MEKASMGKHVREDLVALEMTGRKSPKCNLIGYLEARIQRNLCEINQRINDDEILYDRRDGLKTAHSEFGHASDYSPATKLG